MKNNGFRRVLAALIAAMILLCIFPAMAEDVTISRKEYDRLLALKEQNAKLEEQLSRYRELEQIQEIVKEYFYQETNETTMLEGAARGMLSSLGDPYTFYYNPEEYAQMWKDDEGEYAGVGMMITSYYDKNKCVITRLFTNTPALEAGIQRGDVLYKVEDLEVTPQTLTEAVNIMRGTPGESVHIQVLRDGEIVDFDVVRAIVHVDYVRSCMMENQIGYVALYEFSGDCTDQFIKQVRELEKQGAKGLIVDLRDNPGGWVHDARKICDLFLGEGLVNTMKYYDNSTETNYTADDPDDIDLPLVLVVNENSASASEIVSGCLQDRQRAKVVGTQTFGKGIVQMVLDVGDREAGMQLTIAEYFTPEGHVVHHVGITPDVVVEMPEEDKERQFELGDMEDPQMAKAYEVMQELLKEE